MSTAIPDRYLFRINEGQLTRDTVIKIQGNFSGEYRGIVRADFLTDTGDTVFRVALRWCLYLTVTNVLTYKNVHNHKMYLKKQSYTKPGSNQAGNFDLIRTLPLTTVNVQIIQPKSSCTAIIWFGSASKNSRFSSIQAWHKFRILPKSDFAYFQAFQMVFTLSIIYWAWSYDIHDKLQIQWVCQSI